MKKTIEIKTERDPAAADKAAVGKPAGQRALCISLCAGCWQTEAKHAAGPVEELQAC